MDVRAIRRHRPIASSAMAIRPVGSQRQKRLSPLLITQFGLSMAAAATASTCAVSRWRCWRSCPAATLVRISRALTTLRAFGGLFPMGSSIRMFANVKATLPCTSAAPTTSDANSSRSCSGSSRISSEKLAMAKFLSARSAALTSMYGIVPLAMNVCTLLAPFSRRRGFGGK